MTPESSIPEDSTNQCSVCGQEVTVDSSNPSNANRCLLCGHMVWFRKQQMEQLVILNLMPTMDPEHASFELVGEWLIRPDAPSRVVINFSSVDFVSSTFLGRLLALHKKLTRADRKLALSGLNQVVREIFQITKLENLFEFLDD